LALAAYGSPVNYARLWAGTAEYSFDLSKALQHQTQASLMESSGARVCHPESGRNFWACTPNFGAQLPEFGVKLPDVGRTARPGWLPDLRAAGVAIWRLSPRRSPRDWKGWPRSPEPRAKSIGRCWWMAWSNLATLRCLAELVQRKPYTLR